MLELAIKAAADLNITTNVMLYDATNGAPITGLTFESDGLTLSYVREVEADAQTAAKTQTANGAHDAGGFVEIDSTNCPGLYRIDWHEAAFVATNSRKFVTLVVVCTGVRTLAINVQLVAVPADVTKWIGTAVTLSSSAPDVNIQSSDNIDFGATMKASINTEADTALSDINLDHFMKVAVTDSDVANDTALAHLVGNSATPTWAEFNNTTDSLEALQLSYSPAAVAAAVWDLATSGHVTVGTFGQQLKTDVDTILTRVPSEVAQKSHLVQGSGDITPPSNKGIWDALGTGATSISGLNNITAQNVWEYGTRQLTNANNITSTGNAIVIHTDHKVMLAGTTHTSAVVPTVTVVTNAVGIDWNAISNPTATVGLTNTTVGICTLNSDMVGTNNAALAATALTDVTWTDARAGYIDELSSANIPTDLAAIQTVTDALPNSGALSDIDTGVNNIETQVGTAGAGLTDLGGMSTTMKAQVQSEADDAIVANHLDHMFKTNYDPASKPGTATALFNELVENDGGVSRYTANALEQAPSGAGLSGSQATWLENVYDLLNADKVIVTGTTPWTLEYREKTGKSVLLTQDLKNTSGANITSKSNILGSLVLTT